MQVNLSFRYESVATSSTPRIYYTLPLPNTCTYVCKKRFRYVTRRFTATPLTHLACTRTRVSLAAVGVIKRGEKRRKNIVCVQTTPVLLRRHPMATVLNRFERSARLEQQQLLLLLSGAHPSVLDGHSGKTIGSSRRRCSAEGTHETATDRHPMVDLVDPRVA